MNFGSLTTTYLDAETDALYNKERFVNTFYDFNNYLEKLQDLNSPKSILIGRKGVGKTAYASKLSLIQRGDYLPLMIQLSEVSYSDFSKISDTKSDVKGAQRYLGVWYILLLSCILRKLDENDVEDKKRFGLLRGIISDLGLSKNNNIVRDVLLSSKKNFKVSISKLEISGEIGGAPTKFNTVTELSSYLLDNFLKLGIKKTVMSLIDGVDDVLRIKKDISDIIAGLIRAIHTLNQQNLRKNPVKFILVIREDIVKLVNDPDMNKIIKDRSYTLNWYSNKSSSDRLIQLFNKKFGLSSLNDDFQLWESFFPYDFGEKSSWYYFLQYTMYRPRDVMQFMNQFIEQYPENNCASKQEFISQLKIFSKDYFYEEMKNELLGFLREDIIEDLFAILQKLGTTTKTFKLNDLIRTCADLELDLEAEEIKKILRTLFDAGYVGAMRELQRNDEDQKEIRVNFKHIDPMLRIDYSSKFVIHQGLYFALNI